MILIIAGAYTCLECIRNNSLEGNLIKQYNGLYVGGVSLRYMFCLLCICDTFHFCTWGVFNI